MVPIRKFVPYGIVCRVLQNKHEISSNPSFYTFFKRKVGIKTIIMKIITGDECGLLKEVTLEHTRKTEPVAIGEINGIRRIRTDQDQQTRARGVLSLSFLPNKNSAFDNKEDSFSSLSFAALRINGSVEVWDGIHSGNDAHGHPQLNYKPTKVLSNVFGNQKSNAKPLAIHTFNNVLACCDSSGTMSVISCKNGENLNVVAQYDASAKKGKADQKRKLLQVNEKQHSQTKSNSLFTAFALSDSGRAAIGGRERETTILDVETGRQIWKVNRFILLYNNFDVRDDQ